MGKLRNIFGVDTTTAGKQQAEKSAVRGLIEGSGNSSSWKLATVVEIINDPYFFANEYALPYIEAGLIESREQAIKFPRNTLLVSVEGDYVGAQLIPCIPFLSSHIGMPIKVGESVWISEDGSPYAYWHGRAGGEKSVENPNFAFKDIKFTEENEAPEDAKTENQISQGQMTLRPWKPSVPGKLDETEEEDEKNKKSAKKANKRQQKKENEEEPEQEPALREIEDRDLALQEIVPRWTPRPGDCYIQGSNNTLISLGTDRGYGWDDDITEFPYSSASVKPKEKSGTIDIVVGRGNFESSSTTANKRGSFKGTAPMTIQTADEKPYTIVDLIPGQNKLVDNPREGDPHFKEDMSRIYVSMHTEVDNKFYPVDNYGLLYLDVEDRAGPTISMRTNNFRIYGREDGDIRIIHEGDGATTQSSIILHPDGKITISGDHIILGRKDANNDTDHAGDYSAQPWVKYSNLYDYFEEFHDILDQFMRAVQVNRSPGHFQTDVVLKNAASKFNSAQKSLFQNKIKLIQSERIWGE